MTGQEDIETTCNILYDRLKTLDNVPDMQILPIYSQLRSDEQAKIFEKSRQKEGNYCNEYCGDFFDFGRSDVCDRLRVLQIEGV